MGMDGRYQKKGFYQQKGFISYLVLMVMSALLMVWSLAFTQVQLQESIVRDQALLTQGRYACERGLVWCLAYIKENQKLPDLAGGYDLESKDDWTVRIEGPHEGGLPYPYITIQAIHKEDGLMMQYRLEYKMDPAGHIEIEGLVG